MKRYFALFGLLVLLLPLHAQGYKIALDVKGVKNDTVVLGEYFTTRMIPKDTIVLNSKGKGTFVGEEPFKGGLYLIYFNQKYFFDFLLDKNQVFSIKADTSDFITKTSFEGCPDNELFWKYKNLLKESRELANGYRTEMSEAKNRSDSARVRKELDELDNNMDQFYSDLVINSPDLFVTKFLAATRDPVAPDSILKGSDREIDSIKYIYFTRHYLDNFDVSDVRLLHTPIYDNKIKTYISRAVSQHPDSLKVAVDFLIEQSRSDEEIFRYMVITLFNHFAESKFMGMDAVYFHIAEKYYIPEATWSNPDFLEKLKENLVANKPTLIGETAPNLEMRKISPEHFQMAALNEDIKNDPHIGENFMTHDIKTRFTIIYFWEGDCGHCKTATPKLHEVYQRLKKQDVEIISVHVINSVEGKQLWVDFVNEHKLYDWINCWSPYSNEFRKLYNLQSFPQLFILDESKKIIAKKVSPEQAEDIINTFIEHEL